MEKRPFEKEARKIAGTIRAFAESPDAIDNFESYLSMHFDSWMKDYAGTPAKMASEFAIFSKIA